jgi:hypothetical protein
MSAYAYVGKKLSDGINSSNLTGSLFGTSSFNISSSFAQTSFSSSFASGARSLFTSLDYGVKTLSASVLTASIISASNITASEIKVSGSIDFSGSFDFSGFNFNEFSFNSTTNTLFGSGSDPSIVSHSFTGSINLTGSGIFPPISTVNSASTALGSSDRKFSKIFAVDTFFGGIHEVNLETKGLNKLQEGTILSLKNDILSPCEIEADPLVMAVVSKESNYPLVLGAEPVLITGKIKTGDYIITSNMKGHGKGIDPEYIYNKQLYGKIIAQALEDGDGDSFIIKAMIRKI